METINPSNRFHIAVSDASRLVTPSDEQLAAIHGLLTNGTDAAAARKLNVSVRTLRRRISEITTQLDVTSRMALGFVVARNGWFDEPLDTAEQLRE